MIRCGYRGATSGGLYVDNCFKKNIEGAQAAGINVGVYFFPASINVTEAVEEANYVADLLKDYKIKYPVAIDSETALNDATGRADKLDKQTRTDTIVAFCNAIQAKGYTPMVYASRDWYYNNLDYSRLSQYDIWLAHYTGSASKLSDFKYKYHMWQYTSSGSISGISGNVDVNIGYKKY